MTSIENKAPSFAVEGIDVAVAWWRNAMLGPSLSKSNVGVGVFPMKTSMFISFERETVTVRAGYGAEDKAVYPAAENQEGGAT